MLIKTRGIVIRSIKYSESSLICDIYTEELGLRTYIISGVRKTKARISASLLQIMSILDLVAYNKKNKDLNRVKEIKPAYLYNAVPFDAGKRAVGVFMTELVRKTVSEAEANPALFNFLYQSFTALDNMEKTAVANMHLHFMVHLSRFLGFMPGGAYNDNTPFFDLKEGVFCTDQPELIYSIDKAAAHILYQFITANQEDIQEIKISGEIRQYLLDKLVLFYRYHIENMKELHAHVVLREVMK